MLVKLHIDTAARMYVLYVTCKYTKLCFFNENYTLNTKNDNTKTCKNVENTTLISRTTSLHLCG